MMTKTPSITVKRLAAMATTSVRSSRLLAVAEAANPSPTIIFSHIHDGEMEFTSCKDLISPLHVLWWFNEGRM